MFLLSRSLEVYADHYTHFSSPVSLRLIRNFLGALSLLLLCVTSHALAIDVTLSWDDPNNNPSAVGGYNLYYWQTGTTPLVVSVGKTKIYTLTGLEAGKTYHFATTAHDGSGDRESAFSNEVTFTVPAAPPPPPPPSPPPANAFIQDSGSNGLVVAEVEHFHARTSQNGHSWTPVTHSGASSASAMQATPNNGTNQDTGYVASSPRLDFQIQFVRTGTHYVWVRGIGPSGSDDSVHVGLNGQVVASSDRLANFSSSWTWSKSTMDGPVATIQVPTAGVHTVNVWMREDGFVFDKLVLTSNTNYTPSGTGPDETGVADDADSDNDGFANGLELYYGADPSDPNSMPSLTDLTATGEVNITHSWKHVNLSPPFLDPVVIAKPLSANGSHPAVARIRNVAPTGFDLRVQEWDYLDGSHTTEAVAYLVMERGTFVFEDTTGKFIMVEAGTLTTNQTTFMSVPFGQSFNITPVVLTAVNTVNEADAVGGRLHNISRTGFQFRLQEQENNVNSHATETIAYVAWEPVTGTIDGVSVDVDTTNVVTSTFYSLGFNLTFNSTPLFLADMQTTNGTDTANLRWRNKDRSGVQVQVDEEQSRDSETTHGTEVVGYITIR